MELVVDANVLFSAAIKDSKTAELLLRDDVAYHALEYLFDEFDKYRAELIEKTHRDGADYRRFVEILKRRIARRPSSEFRAHLDDAREISPDPGDVPYFALALHMDATIWSDDRALAQQDVVPVLDTSDLIARLP